MDGRSRAWGIVLTGLLASACASSRGAKQELRFPETQVTGDLDLARLNDEELFAAANSAFATGDFKLAARAFGRIADFHPQSRHLRPALYNAGLSHQRMSEWEEAYLRFSELGDAARGTGDALDAAFRAAETLYHLDRYEDAAALLALIAARTDLPMNKRLEAHVQQGICILESGQSQEAEKTLRAALATYDALPDKDEVDDYFPAQAQFFLGEIYRLHYLSVALDPEKGLEQLGKDLEYKAELLLSAQGHYLRAIRMGNGYWATASGAQIGGLYENLYEHMTHAPVPSELNAEEGEVYRQELRKKIRVLITKAITVYERTLEAAERIGASNPFVDKTRENLRKMKELLVADATADETEGAETQAGKEEPSARPPTESPGAESVPPRS